MRTPLEILNHLRHVTEWSRPNIKFDETMALISELEEVLSTTQIIESKEEIVEIIEEPVVEEPIIEEPVITEETPKKRNYHFKKKEKPVE